MSTKIQGTLVPYSVWEQRMRSDEYIDWSTCRSIVDGMGLGKASIRFLIDFVATLGFYPEDENNPGSPLPGAFTIFPKALVDQVLHDPNPIFVKASGEVFDVGKIKDRFKKLRLRIERENRRTLRNNGYNGTTHSEVFARFNFAKKQVPKIRKLVETFMETYGFLLPEANLCLSKTWVQAGYNYYAGFGPTRSVGPGERRLPKTQFSISQQLPNPIDGMMCITFTYESVHITSSAKKGKKKLNLDKPMSVLARLREFGLPMNAHDMASVLYAGIKGARRKKSRNRLTRVRRGARSAR